MQKVEDDDVGDQVATAALNWFKQQVPAKKHADNEHTVFSAIVVQNGDQYQVVSAGTGTKCVGVSSLCENGLVLADSHAEVLCRRAFVRYLYHQLDKEESNLFQDGEHGKILRAQRKLYMYISEAPCGDAALYDLKSELVEEIHEAKLKRRKLNEEVVTVPCRTTGAKEANSLEHSNVISLARVKSGRTDILPCNRTVSMSCSDKICKWLACGLQGSLLSKWYEPIYLSGIVVSQDKQGDASSFQGKGFYCRSMMILIVAALERSLKRSGNLTCALWVTSKEFPCSKSTSRTSSSGLSLNWSAIDGDTSIEYTLGARGVKMGAKKKLDDAAKRKMCSRLCRRRFFEAANKHEAIDPSMMYRQVKQTRENYNTLKKAFMGLALFQEWKGVPETFNEFKL